MQRYRATLEFELLLRYVYRIDVDPSIDVHNQWSIVTTKCIKTTAGGENYILVVISEERTRASTTETMVGRMSELMKIEVCYR